MSMDMMEFVMEIEDTFGITIPDEHYQHLGNVGSLAEYIVEKCPGSNRDEVWKTVQRIASEQFQIPPEEIVPTARWVEDLKLD